MTAALLAGVVIGVPLGWSILFITAAVLTRPKEPQTKEEWKEWN